MIKEILHILSNFKKKSFTLILFSSFILVLCEIFSIALLLPLLLLVFNQDNEIILYVESFIVEKNLIFINFFTTFLIFVVFVYFLRFLISNYLGFIILDYRASIQKFFSKLALEMFLRDTYVNFKNQNSNQFLVLISKETEKFSRASHALVTLFTESLIILSIIALLFYTNYLATLAIIILCTLILILIKFYFDPFIKRWGESHILHDIKRSTTLSEIYNLYSEIKIFFKINNFKKRFSFDNARTQIAQRNRSFFILLVRGLIEFIIVLVVVISLIFISLDTKDISQYIATISFFFLAMLRILPSFTRCITCHQTILFSKKTINYHLKIINFFKKKNINRNIKIDAVEKFKSKRKSHVLLKNLSFKYDKDYILKDLNLKFFQDSIIGIKGESGSGKTTLIEILLTLLEPTKGKVLYNNKDIFKSKNEWIKKVGYVSQNNNLFVGSIIQNIAFEHDLEKINKLEVENLIKKFNINFFNKFKKILNKEISFNSSNLSGGEKQRISILRGLYLGKKIIILDEATSALDSVNETKILNELVKFKKNRIIIIVSHKSSSLKICDKVFELKNSTILKNG